MVSFFILTEIPHDTGLLSFEHYVVRMLASTYAEIMMHFSILPPFFNINHIKFSLDFGIIMRARLQAWRKARPEAFLGGYMQVLFC